MPLPNHRVVPRGWSAHHRRTVAGQMTATGRIQIPASAAAATFDEATGRTVPAQPTTVYDGPMRVQRLPVGTDVHTAIVGDREVTLSQYRVTIPMDGPSQPVPVGAIVMVTQCGDDPQIIGRSLKVREIPTSTLAWARVLICEDPASTHR